MAAAARATVVVLYASAYGNTAALAQALSRGITKAGPCYLLCLKITAGFGVWPQVLSSPAGLCTHCWQWCCMRALARLPADEL